MQYGLCVRYTGFGAVEVVERVDRFDVLESQSPNVSPKCWIIRICGP